MQTILIVDANPVERNFISRYLTDAGYRILEAADSAEALRIVELCQADIQIAVIASPELMEVATKIAAMQTSLPVVAASHHSGDPVPSGRPESGNITYLQKPLIPIVLLDRIRGLLSPV